MSRTELKRDGAGRFAGAGVVFYKHLEAAEQALRALLPQEADSGTSGVLLVACRIVELRWDSLLPREEDVRKSTEQWPA